MVILMRSAKSDSKVKTDLLKYEVDPETGEVHILSEEDTRLQLKDYEGNIVMPAYP